ncbi:3-isopropylmalate dehydratase large subunit [Limnohabitans sp. MMS-10A-160]|uniref:3-isopropylmalate dehydratase large subunit n=1 Tax=unclassified Limnohabitans TaxID=2626134 RepID=UPI000D35C8E2|nr:MULTISPECIES: 3-isopropylmalate dehydratase large subunit [unclassified Limnohabitans]PUE13929.1 3-isopropylmalate dehydratase large subunit [Limnohabitans sp. MMS-10A-192]PUE22951.1 3-isopropylmalate dehydratase large subunit [Limnohabitans sp. MMS-10A-160]
MPTTSSARTLFDKLWQSHLVDQTEDGESLIYVDRHLVYEVTSPQAFEGLRLSGRQPWRPDTTIAVADHNVPTTAAQRTSVDAIEDPLSRAQVRQLSTNCKEFGITLHGLGQKTQGIIHVVGPEQGATLPGMTVVAGDSHTSTHGAFGALAFGVGTSDVEHVLATQCLAIRPMLCMRVQVNGQLAAGVSAKDLVLQIIGTLGTAGATGYAIEFAGSAIRDLSMEGRMTLCNMAIEAGARVGLVGVDDKTIDYLRGRPQAPQGDQWNTAVTAWRTLVSDEGATFDRELTVDANALQPMVTWGTSPDMVVSIDSRVPDPADEPDAVRRASMQAALAYMDLQAGKPMREIAIDKVFIGSCTNARIEDLRIAADVVRGRRIATNVVQALVVPGSGLVKAQAEAEGLDQIFLQAGLQWREPGCSMCLGMNDDRLSPGERCASTSNRNFEGRQGPGGRSHLLSPALAAAAAIAGHLVRVEELDAPKVTA